MSISLVCELNINSRENSSPMAVILQRLQPPLDSLFQFVSDNPTVEIFNEYARGSDFVYVRFEIKCVDQAQFDLYLASADNVKSVIDSMNTDPDLISVWSASNITYTTSTVENTTTSKGLLTLNEFAEVLAGGSL